MTDVRAATDDLLSEKSDLETPLREVVAVDEDTDTWTFDDVPLDSGVFGELVSRGIVEEVDGEYALADSDAVRRALDGDDAAESTRDSDATVSLPPFDFDRLEVVGVLTALAMVVLFRVLPFRSVFRGDDVVLSGNDPYAYRYLVHELLAVSSNPFDLSVLSALPSGVARGEPLMVTTLWWISTLLGGESAVGAVLAWFPIVSAVVTALLVYALAVRLTDDKRVAIAAVALLAVTPAHAFRTGLGFADHHAFDYPWLALTALAVVSVVDRDIRDRRTLAWAGLLGVGVAGQTLSWDAGPLLLVPLGLFAMVMVPSWLREGRSAAASGAGLIVGVALGAVVVMIAHLGLGWHTQAVVVAPVLLTVGIGGVVALGEITRRIDLSPRAVAGVEVGGLVGGVIILRAVLPAFSTELERGIDFLATTEGIAETTSIVSGDLGTIVGPIFLFGFGLFIALPYMAWAVWTGWRRHAPQWVAVGVYAWYFLVLSVVQIRFAGQLALFAAVFGGLGFVHLAAWVDLVRVPSPFADGGAADGSPVVGDGGDNDDSGDGELEWPERRQALELGVLGLGTGSLGGLMTPIKHSQLTVDESTYEAAQFMREYAEERDWEYPENYVFSEWGKNRVYNWSVNNRSENYRFALAHFDDFLAGVNKKEWYDRLEGRVGFVVTESDRSYQDEDAIYQQLWGEDWGLKSEHYQAIWVNENDTKRVYTLVPGTRVTGSVTEDESTMVNGRVEIGPRSYLVEDELSLQDQGVYDIRIPLPGDYSIGDRSINISDSGVESGNLLTPFSGRAHWPLNEGEGEWIRDEVNGVPGQVSNIKWVNGRKNGSALLFRKSTSSYLDIPIETLQEFTIGLWVYPTSLNTSENNDFRDIIFTQEGSILILGQDGRIHFRLPGVDVDLIAGGTVELNTWNHIAVTFDGENRAIYVGGEQKASDTVSVGEIDWGGLIRLGNRIPASAEHGYDGKINDLRIYRGVQKDFTNLFVT